MQPRRVRIDATSACQLRCPGCPTGTGKLSPTVGTGRLDVDDFRGFLDRHPEIRDVELSNWGEVLLHPELSSILREAHERRVRVTIDNGVNLNTATDEVLDDIVRYEVRSMVVSIDGASQEVYEQYRVHGNLEIVLGNVAKLNALKAAHGTNLPVLTWKMILFGHNQHEISAARKRALELDMVFRTEVNSYGAFGRLEDEPSAKAASGLDIVSLHEHLDTTGSTLVKKFCHQLWNEPQINWDGKLLGCCMNTWSEFGRNVFQNGDLRTERIEYAKRMLLGEAPARDDIPCTTCGEYAAMRSNGRWIRERDVVADRVKKQVGRATTSVLGVRVLQPLGGRLLSWAGAHGR